MHLLAGSYILSSVPRTIFVVVRGTVEETDNSVVLFNPKNSNGPCIGRTAWERTLAGFYPLPDFDWKAFDSGSGGRKVIRLEHIRKALGDDMSKHSDAVKRLFRRQVAENAPVRRHFPISASLRASFNLRTIP